MDFYTTLFVSTMIFLVVILCIIGYFMSISKKKQTYPPSIADCPDYYSLNSNGSCKIGANIKASDIMCNSEDFKQDKYKKEGYDFTSGLCAKKMWANKCEVTWDGITNNDSLCYS
jgi:hypothetical protein